MPTSRLALTPELLRFAHEGKEPAGEPGRAYLAPRAAVIGRDTRGKEREQQCLNKSRGKQAADIFRLSPSCIYHPP